MAATCAALGLVPLVVVLAGVLAGVAEAPPLFDVAVLGAGVGVVVEVGEVGEVVEVAALEFATGVLEVLALAVGVVVLPPLAALLARAEVLAPEVDFPLGRVSCALQAASGMANARTMTSIGAAFIRVLVQGQTLLKAFFNWVIISGSLVEHMRFSLMFVCNFLAA